MAKLARQPLADRSHMALSTEGPTVADISVPLSQIRTDGGTQMRAGLHEDTIDEYAEALRNGEALPPIVVYHDGETYWLADGFHRVCAHKRAHGEGSRIRAIVKSGTRRVAILHAAGANADHGLRRTNADKRRAVESLLSDEEWRAWSDRQIARHCKVDHKTVAAARVELYGDFPIENEERKFITRHGTEATRRVKPKPMPADEAAADAWDATPRADIVFEQAQTPETPADVAEAGFGIEYHPVAKQYRWARHNSAGGASYGPLRDTIDEAVEDARDNVRRGVRFYEPDPRPEGSRPTDRNAIRRARMQAMIDQYRETIATFSEYGDTTGAHTDTLMPRRGLERMITRLERNLEALDR